MSCRVRFNNVRRVIGLLNVEVRGKDVHQILEFRENKVRRKYLLFYFYF